MTVAVLRNLSVLFILVLFGCNSTSEFDVGLYSISGLSSIEVFEKGGGSKPVRSYDLTKDDHDIYPKAVYELGEVLGVTSKNIANHQYRTFWFGRSGELKAANEYGLVASHEDRLLFVKNDRVSGELRLFSGRLTDDEYYVSDLSEISSAYSSHIIQISETRWLFPSARSQFIEIRGKDDGFHIVAQYDLSETIRPDQYVPAAYKPGKLSCFGFSIKRQSLFCLSRDASGPDGGYFFFYYSIASGQIEQIEFMDCSIIGFDYRSQKLVARAWNDSFWRGNHLEYYLVDIDNLGEMHKIPLKGVYNYVRIL